MSASKAREAACWFGGRELLRERHAAWERYAWWARHDQTNLSPAAAMASVGFLYQILPPESRWRPVDVHGVAMMHRLLAFLGCR